MHKYAIYVQYIFVRISYGFRDNHSKHFKPFTRESKKLSALLFFQFIYTKVGVEQVRHFST
jgi:hypothetical protein